MESIKIKLKTNPWLCIVFLSMEIFFFHCQSHFPEIFNSHKVSYIIGDVIGFVFIIISILFIFRPPYILDENGFVGRGLFSEKIYLWSQIRSINTTMVAFTPLTTISFSDKNIALIDVKFFGKNYFSTLKLILKNVGKEKSDKLTQRVVDGGKKFILISNIFWFAFSSVFVFFTFWV